MLKDFLTFNFARFAWLSTFFLASLAMQAEEPWGKDSELVSLGLVGLRDVCLVPQSPPCSTFFLGALGEKLIAFHQNVISPADGPRSHFIPSSSQYTLDAMRKYGFFKGYIIGCDRLMRENPEEWVYRLILAPTGCLMKWDPVK